MYSNLTLFTVPFFLSFFFFSFFFLFPCGGGGDGPQPPQMTPLYTSVFHSRLGTTIDVANVQTFFIIFEKNAFFLIPILFSER